MKYFFLLIFFSIFFFTLSLFKKLGTVRGLSASLARTIWMAPLILLFFPQKKIELHPKNFEKKSVFIFVDDSVSMDKSKNEIANKIKIFSEECKKLGCEIIIDKLSQFSSETKENYTFLNKSFSPWFEAKSDKIWALFTDGRDSFPESLSKKIRPKSINRSGIIISFDKENEENIWLEDLKFPPFAFANKPFKGSVLVRREGIELKALTVQVQLKQNDTILSSLNVEFAKGQDTLITDLSVSGLGKGKYFLNAEVLAIPEERIIFDNHVYAQIEVYPNTLGVLHLLGSPSWDGRFLRRFLTAEPKFDLVSFFILRDPWDFNSVPEKELSLIPFPVARLFNEELNNFKVVILQNFTLLQFLLPEYQKSLVRYVKDGGSLLFVGGKRALSDGDLLNSPLKEIIPFAEINKKKYSANLNFFAQDNFSKNFIRQDGPWFDANMSFAVEFADPSYEEKQLVGFFSEWEKIKPAFADFTGQGLHHLENVTLKKEGVTPLLYAKVGEDKKIPLALASYPGKGRAVWLFTDSFHQIALKESSSVPRNIYEDFMHSTFSWLTRFEEKKQVIIKDLEIEEGLDKKLHFLASLEGPALRYFEKGVGWNFSFCGKKLAIDGISVIPRGNEYLEVSGTFVGEYKERTCEFRLSSASADFGSVDESYNAVIAHLWHDKDLPQARSNLERLAAFSGGELMPAKDATEVKIGEWLADRSLGQDEFKKQEYREKLDYYWIFEKWWFFLLLLFMPVEVFIRRWHLLRNQGFQID